MESNDLSFTGSVVQNDEQAFKKLFTEWYEPLHVYACAVLKEEGLAREAVQAVFCRIWEKREQLRIHTSLRAYLFGSVYHECVNWLRREKRQRVYASRVLRSLDGNGRVAGENATDRTELGQLEERYRQALDELPDQCRAIFQLSRFGELKYREIAEQLGISVKTVEAQMSKALKLLRHKLADFLE